MPKTPALIDDDLDRELDAVDDTPTLVFADALDPVAARRDLILRARRRLTPVRRAAVQLPRETEGSRTGRLIELAADNQHLAFDLEMLYLALQPVTTDGDYLDNGTWARLLSAGERTRRAPAISRAWRVLEDYDLVTRDNGPAELLREDGSGLEWAHPGEADARDPIGYFSIPRAYWLRGYCDALTLPGKAMLLILLSETNDLAHQTLTHSHARFAQYYGISESSVKRGLNSLRECSLLGERWEKQPAARSKSGYRQVGHYWLLNPFSTQSREQARKVDASERGARATAPGGGGGDAQQV